MMKKKAFTFRVGLPVALFIFAGNMLSVGKGNLIELLLSAAFGALALPVATVAASAVFGESEKKGAAKIFFAILSLLTAVAAIYVAALTVNDISRFVEGVMLLRLPRLAVGIIFVALCSYLAATGNSTIKKFSFVAALIVCASSIILFALSFQSLEADRVYDIIRSAGEISIKGVIKDFSLVFAPAVIAVIYISASEKEKGSSLSSFWGALIATLLLTVCFLNVFLLLGGSLAASEDYPYATAVSTVTAGKLFARMEGFAYIMYYAAGVVRVSVCIALINLLSERLARKKWRFLPYIIGTSVFLVTLFLSQS